MRILVTGSRNHPSQDMVAHALSRFAIAPNVTVVHGDCPTGADKYASFWCKTQPDVTEEAHPADWERHGKAAGPIRNQEMVDLGADICIAFPHGVSRGTWDCVRRAEKAGIRVHVIR